MKKLVYIVAGLAMFFVAALVGLVLYITTRNESDKNKKQTEAARQARWNKSVTETNNQVVQDADKLLEEIKNQTKDEDKT